MDGEVIRHAEWSSPRGLGTGSGTRKPNGHVSFLYEVAMLELEKKGVHGVFDAFVGKGAGQ